MFTVAPVETYQNSCCAALAQFQEIMWEGGPWSVTEWDELLIGECDEYVTDANEWLDECAEAGKDFIQQVRGLLEASIRSLVAEGVVSCIRPCIYHGPEGFKLVVRSYAYTDEKQLKDNSRLGLLGVT